MGLSICSDVCRFAELVSDQNVDHRVQVVEKRQEVEGHLGPSFVHCKIERVAIHDCRRIVEPRLNILDDERRH